MKNRFSQITRKFGFGVVLVAGSLLANAQTQSDEPSWAVSKDVQKVSNKALFNDQELRDSHIRAVVISPTWNTKGVHSVGQSSDIGKGNVASTGIPDIAIGKGVQKISRPKKESQKEQDNMFKTNEEITRNR
jgi:hypothetical protein